jgi:hypothetical protein
MCHSVHRSNLFNFGAELAGTHMNESIRSLVKLVRIYVCHSLSPPLIIKVIHSHICMHVSLRNDQYSCAYMQEESLFDVNVMALPWARLPLVLCAAKCPPSLLPPAYLLLNRRSLIEHPALTSFFPIEHLLYLPLPVSHTYPHLQLSC